jgi:uncharacterized protein with GYD domain
MPKYLARLSLTAEGVRALQKDGAASRRAAAAKLIESLGGKLESYYYAFGEHDVIGIADLPDNDTAVAVSVAVNAVGLIKYSITPLLTVEEMDKALAKSRNLQPPGR